MLATAAFVIPETRGSSVRDKCATGRLVLPQEPVRRIRQASSRDLPSLQSVYSGPLMGTLSNADYRYRRVEHIQNISPEARNKRHND